MGHRPHHRLGQAGFRQGDGLAGQPFQVAVFAHMDQRLGAPDLADPDVEGQVIVRRGQVGGVVGFLRVDIVAARGLDADHDIAMRVEGEFEPPGALGRGLRGMCAFGCLRRRGERVSRGRSSGPVLPRTGGAHLQDEAGGGEVVCRQHVQERVVLGRAPAVGDLLLHVPGQGVEIFEVGIERQELAAGPFGTVGQVIGRAGQDIRHQRVAVGRGLVDRIARLRQQVQRVHGGGGRVEADAIGQPSILVRVIRQDDRRASVGGGGAAQGGPVGGEAGDEVDPVAPGLPAGDRAFRRLVVEAFALERHGAGQDAAIDLRQGHVHRDVAGREAGQRLLPNLFGGGGEHDLEDRAVVGRGRGERVGRAVVAMRRADGEGGEVQDHLGPGFGKEVIQRRRRNRVLQ